MIASASAPASRRPSFGATSLGMALLILMGCASTARGQVAIPADFALRLRNVGLRLDRTLFTAYTLAPIVENRDMRYELALRSPDDLLEVRYAVRTDPGAFAELAFATLLNVGNADPSKALFTRFDSIAVRREFNADGGGTGAFSPRRTFARSFDTGLMVVTWARNRGMTYTFFLFNERGKEAALLEVQRVFHALTFR